MSKHTPGPWHVVTGNKNRKFDEAVIRHAQPSGTHPVTLARVTAPKHPIGVANARLIASAPELLEALQVMTSLVRTAYGNLDAAIYAEIQKAEATIAKATQ